MSLYVIDVESDGPVPGPYSMVCFGAVKVDRKLDKTFYGQTWPISPSWDPEALAISGFNREQHMHFPDPMVTFADFYNWIMDTNEGGRPIFFSDNLAYDWQWINYYFTVFTADSVPLRERNPFGYSGRRIGDLYCGFVNDTRARWKYLRSTTHDHNPVNDAKGNAEALLKMVDMGLNLKIK